MKTMFRILLATAFLSAVTFLCASFKPVDNNPLAISSINTRYEVWIPQIWCDFYDVYVAFRDENGRAYSFKVIQPKRFIYTITRKPYEAPREYGLQVTVTPKKDHPAIDRKRKYVFETEIICEFYALRNNGEVFKELSSDLYPYSNTKKTKEVFSGEELVTSMNRNSKKYLCNFSKTWDGKY